MSYCFSIALTIAENTMSKNAIRLKSELVRTRKVIAQKFKQSHHERVKRERTLGERFAPVTNSIDKLARGKPNIEPLDPFNIVERTNPFIDDIHDRGQDQNQFIDYNMEPNENDIDPGPLEDNNDGDSDVDMVEVLRPATPPISPARKRSREDVESPLPRGKRANRKKSRFNAVNVDEGDENETRKKRLETKRLYDLNQKRVSRLKRVKELRERAMTQVAEKTKKDVRASRELALIKAMEMSKNSATPLKSKRTSKRIVVSPEDFDIETGVYRGVKSQKRRKIEVSPSQLDQVKVVRRKKSATVGASLERAFIPYNQNIVYEYYDDPNELCVRLKLLLSSKSAGNSNHDQEINSIVEELRERSIIE